ncbi:MAG: class I SAM-dependent RNA methyltransferase [bacterium]
MQLKILTPLYGGLSLAKDGPVYFVKGTIPGETVEVLVKERKKDYLLSDTVRVLAPSPFRQSPPCPSFGICGGCHYQFIAYERQLTMKQEIIYDCLTRIGKLDNIPFDKALSGNPYHYRHRAQLKASQGRLGFYRENSHDVIEFETCLLLSKRLNDCCSALKEVGIPPHMTDITITVGDSVIAHIGGTKIGDDYLKSLLDKDIIQGITTDNGRSFGAEYTTFEARGYRYTVSPQSFLQSNWEMNKAVIKLLGEHLQPESGGGNASRAFPQKGNKQRLLDVFGGAGNFSLPLSADFHTITVVEENPHSIRDGRRNAVLNNITNISFAQEAFEEFSTSARYSTVTVDPPRVGLSSRSLKKIRSLAPESLFYISCNPATLSRDAAKLKDLYQLRTVRLIDMFPQTYHCEIFCHFGLQ